MDVSNGRRPQFRGGIRFDTVEALAEHRHLELLRAAGLPHPKGRKAQRTLVERRAQKLGQTAADFHPDEAAA